MARGRTKQVLVTRVGGDDLRREPDRLVVEEPLAIHVDDYLAATTMRTPGNDFELAAGFCHAEGLLDAQPIVSVRYCGEGPPVETDFNVVTVDTGGRAPVPTPRLGVVSAACGVCGAESIDALRERLRPLPPGEPISLQVVAAVPDRVRGRQELFDATGAVHAAAAFDRAGALVVVREDIGRHNAVDKVVGRLLLDGLLPARDLGLFVSGRASFEMVQKAWAAGMGTVVAVSAPSSLAVETAAAAGMVLAGFARDGAMNVYAGSLD